MYELGTMDNTGLYSGLLQGNCVGPNSERQAAGAG